MNKTIEPRSSGKPGMGIYEGEGAMSQRSRWVAVALIGLLVLAGATGHAEQEDIAELVEGNSAFAFDLYHELGNGGNLFFSPYSISAAPAMTFAGARTGTQRPMANVLHFPPGQAGGHPAVLAPVRSLVVQVRVG